MKTPKNKLAYTKFGNLLRPFVYLYRLPRYVHYFETQISRLRNDYERANKEVSDLKTSSSKQSKELIALENFQLNFNEKLSDLRHENLVIDSKPSANQNSTTNIVNNTISDDHTHDKFYKNFEDRFRGSEEMIKKRLAEYSPYIKSLSKTAKKLPVLDIGCGRGEFLQVVTGLGLKAVGVDMNKSMVKRAKDLGFEAYEDDALSFLIKQKKSSFSVISGFHLVEHIPFASLLTIFGECYRTIHEDGFVLFETPNPNNLSVGAANFYMDPSHIKPLPPALLAFAMESQGFHTQIVELHPAKENLEHDDPVVADMMRMLYGPLDYAILASKKPISLID